MFSNFFFLSRAVYEIVWHNTVGRDRPTFTIWRTLIACWISIKRKKEKKKKNTHTHTHTGCVILLVFPLQQWVHERASMLRYTYIACLVLCWRCMLFVCHSLSVTWHVHVTSLVLLELFSKVCCPNL